MSNNKKGNWGGNRKSKYDFKLETTAVRIPKPYHKACQEYAKQLEDQDVDNGNLIYIAGDWVYRIYHDKPFQSIK